MTAPAARICCLDLDTFFVSAERLLNPSLEGKPVIVGGSPGQRGVVTACSYEVRAFGVHSGMSLTKAAQLCPNAIFLPGTHGAYSPYARQVQQAIEGVCPVVQVASIDEFFFDMSGCERMYRRPVDADADATILRTMRELTAAIKAELGLPASVGIATSRSVAKIASGLAKPAGVLLVPAGREAELLAPLPVRKFPGIGPVAEGKLHQRGIETLGQLARVPLRSLEKVFGAWAPRIKRGARGEAEHDLGRDRPAFREHDPDGLQVGSISNERTFREDVGDPRQIDAMLCGLCERVCWRARKRGIKARTVTLKLRYADFHTLTRARTITPTSSELELYPTVREIYEAARTRRLRIRLLGLALSRLGFYDDQLRLFDDGSGERLHRAVDAVREKFGYDAVRLAPRRREIQARSRD